VPLEYRPLPLDKWVAPAADRGKTEARKEAAVAGATLR